MSARVCITAAASGLALQLAFPPVGLAWLAIVAWLPLLVVLHARPARQWLAAGLIAGLCWFAMLPLALASWGLALSLLVWWSAALLVAATLGATGALQHMLPDGARWLAFPTAWALAAFAGDRFLELPLSLAAAFALDAPWALVPARAIGAIGWDSLLCGGVALAASALSGAPSRRGALVWAVLALLALAVGHHAAPSSAGRVPVQLIQPSVPTAEYRGASWSLAIRSELESRLDALTAQAIERGPSLVIWPEGGNGLANARLPRRRARLAALLAGRDAELLVASQDLSPTGARYNALSLVTRAGFVEHAYKTHVVPIAESGLARGEAAVLHSRFGALGAAICFDSVFSDHSRALVRRGAELLVAVSDDASFGRTGLARWHAAYSILRAIEVGRPLVFASNRGPLVVTDASGRQEQAEWVGEQAGVHQASVARASGRTPAAAGTDALIALALAACTLLAARRQSADSHVDGTEWGAHGLAASLLRISAQLAFVALLAPASASIAGALATGTAPRAFAIELARSTKQGAAVDAIAPVFMQRSTRSCGAAALAYALTMLGDEVYEGDLVAELAPAHAEGYSFAELVELAASRGFAARGLEGGLHHLPRVGAAPVLAHMQRGHFVVVVGHDGTDVFFFDPATGRTHVESAARFARDFDGRFLRLLPARG